MMQYTFRCGACGQVQEIWQTISDCHSCPPCPCGGIMGRVFNAQIIGDEIKSTKYIGRDGKEHKDHGYTYDIGLGAGYSSKQERKRIMKAKGLHEIGGSMV